MDLKAFFNKNRTYVYIAAGVAVTGVVIAASMLSGGGLFQGAVGIQPLKSPAVQPPPEVTEKEVQRLPSGPNVKCSYSPSNPKIGDAVTFTATATGFFNSADSLTYVWSGAVSGQGKTKTKAFSGGGSYIATVNAMSPPSDIINESDTDNCSVQVTEPAIVELPTVTCAPNKTTGTVGDSITWTASFNPSGSYDTDIFWDGEGLTGGTNNPINVTYSTAGVKQPSVAVKFHPSGQLKSAICSSINIQADEPADEPPADEPPADEPPADEPPADEPPADEPPPQSLLPAQDIVSCVFTGKEVALDTPFSVIAECKLTKNGLIGAQVVKGKFDPAVQLTESDIIRTLAQEKSQTAKTYLYTWDLKDKYDTKVEEGDYSLVISARPSASHKYDYSIHNLTVVKTSAELSSQQQTASPEDTGDETPQPQTPGASPEEGPASGQPEAPSAEPSGCPGVNYPTDIAGHWGESHIKRAYDACIVKGYEDGRFRPDFSVSRGEAVKIVLSGAGVKPFEGCYDADCGSPFMDLSMWHGPWLRPAAEKKIVEGYTPTIFCPECTLTRAESVALVARAFGVPPHQGCFDADCGAGYPREVFTDIVDMWQGPWLRALSDRGWITGVRPGIFQPNRPITRAELVKIVLGAAGGNQ